MKKQIDTKGLQSIVDGQLALGLKAVEAAEQLGALQLNTTKALLEQSVKQHQALLSVKMPQEFGAIANDASKPLAQITQTIVTVLCVVCVCVCVLCVRVCVPCLC